MHGPEKYKTYLGDEKYYHDFLVFFQEEMDKKGWENVLNEYLFKGDEIADDMLVRMYGGQLYITNAKLIERLLSAKTS